MTKHIHADLIMAYAKLAQETDKPWDGFQYRIRGNEEWLDCGVSVRFWFGNEYRLKPRTVKIGEIDVPEPVREPLERDQEYFVVATTGLFPAEAGIWDGAKIHMRYLERGLIHLNRESAELHAKALIALTQK
ncbi:hypothetical protein ABLA30_22830 [Xenorhabdus nematophila]|uniref:hypothetical protein n=1 Tax=Xenorhabdus nematophila TaxID=628 RepID=UPI0032B7DDD8